MSELPVEIGRRVSFSKTVGESDVYLFAGITGDLSPNHVDEAYMAGSRYGRRIAHGALLVGFMSNASSRIVAGAEIDGETVVSLGYDRIRFLGPVFIGDTITVGYEIVDVDPDRRRATSQIEIANQDGELVAVGRHILKWVPDAD